MSAAHVLVVEDDPRIAQLLLDYLRSEALQAKQIAELQSRFNKNSRNSSKPLSSDGLNKPTPKSLRIAGQRPTGGQKGHSGSTPGQSAQPDQVPRPCFA